MDIAAFEQWLHEGPASGCEGFSAAFYHNAAKPLKKYARAIGHAPAKVAVVDALRDTATMRACIEDLSFAATRIGYVEHLRNAMVVPAVRRDLSDDEYDSLAMFYAELSSDMMDNARAARAVALSTDAVALPTDARIDDESSEVVGDATSSFESADATSVTELKVRLDMAERELRRVWDLLRELAIARHV